VASACLRPMVRGSQGLAPRHEVGGVAPPKHSPSRPHPEVRAAGEPRRTRVSGHQNKTIPAVTARIILHPSPRACGVATNGRRGEAVDRESFRSGWRGRTGIEGTIRSAGGGSCLLPRVFARPAAAEAGMVECRVRLQPRPCQSHGVKNSDRVGEARSHQIADYPLRDGASPMPLDPGRAGGFTMPEAGADKPGLPLPWGNKLTIFATIATYVSGCNPAARQGEAE
jgi:hypothetical protein